ncbi:apolipoprotein N-acyltransferase [Novosphingobium kunmingense]|uniref:Apolipoprotein N-acyltransferase n=1 Tax=Novosphingobium kunmingense TaxID=1211806 RepID=A0A2N0HJZ5_9SPHN|nr:apolipoprotein N-acyltransferase [Novosphingobium kunmingense]PKB19271.1 apolipoprotein N-acyltransferase [Novosphingobium kunmingense]
MPRALDLYRNHPRLAALLCGALTAAGFAPLHLAPLALLGVVGLLDLVARAANWKQAALAGWLFGVGHFCIGNGWIATAFTYQAAMPAWLGWLAVVLLSLYLAVYPLLAALGAWMIGRRGGPALVLAFAGCWIISEWLRSWVFTGFAWNPLGALALGSFARPGLAAVLPFTGTYALSGVVALLGGVVMLGLRRGLRDWRGMAGLVAPLLLLSAPFTPLAPAPGPSPAAGPAFTLVQPWIPQDELNDPAMFPRNFARLAKLSTPLAPGEPRLLLWPESGVPDYLREGYPEIAYLDNFGADPIIARTRLGRVAGPGGVLLTGATDLEEQDGRIVGARNAVTAIDAGGAIVGSYAKAHLVPYGEYLPMRSLLTPLGLSRLVPGSIDFWPGPGPQTLDLGQWGRVGVQVCYEIIFSGQVADRENRPAFLFNPSNDGWFGSWGPPQHLAQARMRAIEEGLPVLRATTTGISAVIEPSGVVRNFVPRNQGGRIDGAIPAALPPTPFARLGNMLALLWAAAFLVASVVASRRARG